MSHPGGKKETALYIKKTMIFPPTTHLLLDVQ